MSKLYPNHFLTQEYIDGCDRNDLWMRMHEDCRDIWWLKVKDYSISKEEHVFIFENMRDTNKHCCSVQKKTFIGFGLMAFMIIDIKGTYIEVTDWIHDKYAPEAVSGVLIPLVSL